MSEKNRKTAEWIGGIVLLALVLVGCFFNANRSKTDPADGAPGGTSSLVQMENVPGGTGESSSVAEEGPRTPVITLSVVHGDGQKKDFDITTTAKTLGEALLTEELIAGEEGPYGLYVKTVDGETVNDDNQEWWCLTKGGGTVMTGVDSTEIADGETYELTFTVGY